jgi:aromatic-L-amino-acid/L-tryptophan decarboxylase
MTVSIESGSASGDIPLDEFRAHGHRTVDWIADYLAGVGRLPVLAQVRPGEVAAQLPPSPPQGPEEFEAILADIDRIVIPGTTHWNHPAFFAYFANTASGPGILGEMVATALNTNAMLWRTGPAATELEGRTLEWLREMMGLAPDFRGTIQDTASISTLIAIAAAREALELGIREHGLAGRDLPKLRLYASDHVHSSIDKAAITLGLGMDGLRKIPCDAEFRMRPEALEAAIQEDLAAGIRPFCVVATIGTTSTSSVDPVPAIAEICARHALWLHVDAAYGGGAAIVPELRPLFAGTERADSLVVNPHKWLFVPMDCSVLYARRLDVVRRAFSLVPEYLVTPEGDEVLNLMDYGPALGKRFRALKLWVVMRRFGAEGMIARVREHVRLARRFASWVEAEAGWRLLAPVPFSLVVFRHEKAGMTEAEIEAHNERIMSAVNATGEAFLSHTKLDGRYTLRLAVGNLRTTEEHVARAWQLLQENASRL